MDYLNYPKLISSDLKKRATMYLPRKKVELVTFMYSRTDPYQSTPLALDLVVLWFHLAK
jgi:hypothetical protein